MIGWLLQTRLTACHEHRATSLLFLNGLGSVVVLFWFQTLFTSPRLCLVHTIVNVTLTSPCSPQNNLVSSTSFPPSFVDADRIRPRPGM